MDVQGPGFVIHPVRPPTVTGPGYQVGAFFCARFANRDTTPR